MNHQRRSRPRRPIGGVVAETVLHHHERLDGSGYPQQLVGDQAEVVSLMPPGVDPHLYKASVRDLDLLTQADLVVYHGLYLEGKMTEIFD